MVEFLAMLSGGLVAFFAGFFYIRGRKNTVSNGRKTSAEIVGTRRVKTGYSSYVLSYYIDGKKHTVCEPFFQNHTDKSRIGKKVTIIVAEDDPEKFVYAKDKGVLWYTVGALLPGAAIIVASVILFITGYFENI